MRLQLSSLKHRISNCLARFGILALLYVAMAALALGANPFKGETVGPFDLLASYPGWHVNGHDSVVPRHMERSDILDAELPMWINAREQIRSGHLPLWNPLRAGGTPALLDPTNLLLTPAFVIFASAPSEPMGFYFAVLLNLTVAGMGMHLLVRRYAGFSASLFAGGSYMLCGFITAWLYWPHTHTAMWIPWLLLAVDRYLAGERWRNVLPISVATGLMFLGGFPFVVAIGLGVALLWALLKSLASDATNTFPNVVGVMAGIALGLGLVAVPLLGLKETLETIDLGARAYGSPLRVSSHLKLLSLPWAARDPHVETNMYAGMLVLPLALAGAIIGFFNRRARLLSWTGLAFTVLGALLVFEILPREIGGHLPVLNSSVWSRCILLLDLGLVLLAACGLENALSWIKPKPALIGAAAAILVVQGVDLGRQFRRFNGPTSAALYFADSPVIQKLRAEIRPFQYVGQDSSVYMLSGTLGARGLAEWYAHSLRSPKVQTLLRAMAPASMTTPTATQINLDGYRWQNSLLDAAGLCYGIGSSNWQSAPIVQSAPTGEHAALPPISGRVRQTLKLARGARLSAVGVRMATYGRSDLDGTVAFALADASGRQISPWVRRNAGDVADNQMLSFAFAAPVELAAGDYQIWLEYLPGSSARPLTAWRQVAADGFVETKDQRLPGTLEYVLYGTGDSGLSLETVAPGGMYARNPGCSEGAYFAERVDAGVPDIHSDRVALKAYLPHRFTLQVSPGVPGYVVVPMQYAKGWEARVDGRKTPVRLALGVMPAVPVDTAGHRVEFRYFPPFLLKGGLISLASLAMLLLLYWRRGDSKKGISIARKAE